jgi:hypothetical protein
MAQKFKAILKQGIHISSFFSCFHGDPIGFYGSSTLWKVASWNIYLHQGIGGVILLCIYQRFLLWFKGRFKESEDVVSSFVIQGRFKESEDVVRCHI